jgi:soluble lytic murein transglycosylase
VQAYVTKDYASQRALFQQVEADLKKGKILSYRNHKQTLSSYPLFPYLKYELYRKMIDQLKHAELSAFIKNYPDSPLPNKLRNEWLRHKAAKKMWQDYLLAYDPYAKNDVEMQCHYINANLDAGKKESFDLIPSIWLTSKTLPKSCDPVISAWKAAGLLTRNLLWQRIKLSLEDNNPQLAKHLAKDLSEADQKMVELWIRTHNDPNLIKKAHYYTAKHSAISEIIIHGMRKIAKNNPQQGVKLWEELQQRHTFNEYHWGVVVKEIGLALARKLDHHSEKWLSNLPERLRTKEVSDARLKVAVHHNDWDAILNTYEQLPEEELRSDKWQYWQARAVEMIGDRDASQAALSKLAQMRNYYGFLASARVLQPYAMNHESNEIDPEVMQSVQSKPAVIRAYELKQIGRIHTGKTEWLKALEDLDENQRLAAAQLAADWNVPNWAIVALANAVNKNDLVLRFPKTYSEHIHREAARNRLDPALVFAITRQESAFIPTARSPVGAMGLMQIMPATGKMLARLNKETLHNPQELLKPDKNIRLGSKYIRMMLDTYQQNAALAAASYNAGPHRVARWLPDYDMPADSWIETIPFRETREYVQNVMTYAVIYKKLLGNTPRLNNYMPIINGNKRVTKK